MSRVMKVFRSIVTGFLWGLFTFGVIGSSILLVEVLGTVFGPLIWISLIVSTAVGLGTYFGRDWS